MEIKNTDTAACRFQRDPAFAEALIDEVALLHRCGEPEVARDVLLLLVMQASPSVKEDALMSKLDAKIAALREAVPLKTMPDPDWKKNVDEPAYKAGWNDCCAAWAMAAQPAKAAASEVRMGTPEQRTVELERLIHPRSGPLLHGSSQNWASVPGRKPFD